MATKSKSSKKGGATFGYVEQFNYPLSPCYKNQVKAGWHSGGDGSCTKKSVEGLTTESNMNGGSFFDFLLSDSEKKKTKKKSKTTKTTKPTKTTKTTKTTSEKKKKKTTSATKKKKPSKK
jgi:hypothetical protein